MHTDEPEIVEVLLKNHADMNRQDKLGRTPLYMATATKSEKVVNLLVKAKANLNLAEKHGKTPLHEAAKYGYDHIAEALIENGADLFATDKKGRTAKDIATRRGSGWKNVLYISNTFQTHNQLFILLGHTKVAKLISDNEPEISFSIETTTPELKENLV